MAQVTLRINGHAYTIGCQDGEETHLMAMAEAVEQRIEQAKALGVQSGESKLLVMAALFMADELHDASVALQTTQKPKGEAKSDVSRAKAERLARLATRAEEIAASAEQH